MDHESASELQNVLREHKLLCLFPKFYKAGVDKEILWELDDTMLDEASLTTIEKTKYGKAKIKYQQVHTGKFRLTQAGPHYYLIISLKGNEKKSIFVLI